MCFQKSLFFSKIKRLSSRQTFTYKIPVQLNFRRKCSTAWKVSKYGVFSGPYFPALGLNTERCRISPYSVRMRGNTDQKQLRIWTIFTQSWQRHFQELLTFHFFHPFSKCHPNERENDNRQHFAKTEPGFLSSSCI